MIAAAVFVFNFPVRPNLRLKQINLPAHLDRLLEIPCLDNFSEFRFEISHIICV